VDTSAQLIVIGTSLGGMRALEVLFGGLMPDFPLPIAVVQHRGTDAAAQSQLASLLQTRCALSVCEAEDKQPIAGGSVYLAPPDYHLLVDDGHFALSVDERVSYARPSIDVLFESAAEVYRRSLVAVLLTGASNDGTRGAKRVRELGGRVVAQDPRTAEAPVMPQSAIHAAAVDLVLPLDEIAPYLNVASVQHR
jgi:two-component system, chemotaxis family, protein-glutamate methylesterase/glutaminase